MLTDGPELGVRDVLRDRRQGIHRPKLPLSRRESGLLVGQLGPMRRSSEPRREIGIGGLDGVKVIMTTALGDSKNIMGSFSEGCEAYIVKPIRKQKLIEEMAKLGLAQPVNG